MKNDTNAGGSVCTAAFIIALWRTKIDFKITLFLHNYNYSSCVFRLSVATNSVVSEFRGDATIHWFKGGGIGRREGKSVVAGRHQRENTRELPPRHLSRLCKAAVSRVVSFLKLIARRGGEWRQVDDFSI